MDLAEEETRPYKPESLRVALVSLRALVPFHPLRGSASLLFRLSSVASCFVDVAPVEKLNDSCFCDEDCDCDYGSPVEKYTPPAVWTCKADV